MAAILVIAPFPILRHALSQLLRSEFGDPVIGEAGDVQSALRQVGMRAWDMVIVDASVANGDIHNFIAHMRRMCPTTKVLILSDHPEQESAVTPPGAGVCGCVSKMAEPLEVRNAIRSLRARGHYLGPPARDKARSAWQTGSPPSSTPLSVREREVLVRLARGAHINRIAAELNISSKTVTTYRRRILNKLDLGSTAALIRYADSRGLA